MFLFKGSAWRFRVEPLVQVVGMGMGIFDSTSSHDYLEHSWYHEMCGQLGYLLLRRQDEQWELRQISTYDDDAYYRCLFIGVYASHDQARRQALKYGNDLASRLNIKCGSSLRNLMKRFAKRSDQNYHKFKTLLAQAIDQSEKQRSWAELHPESVTKDQSELALNFWHCLNELE